MGITQRPQQNTVLPAFPKLIPWLLLKNWYDKLTIWSISLHENVLVLLHQVPTSHLLSVQPKLKIKSG